MVIFFRTNRRTHPDLHIYIYLLICNFAGFDDGPLCLSPKPKRSRRWKILTPEEKAGREERKAKSEDEQQFAKDAQKRGQVAAINPLV